MPAGRSSPFSIRYVSPLEEVALQRSAGKSLAKIKSDYRTLHTRICLGFIITGLMVFGLAKLAGALSSLVILWNVSFILSWSLYLLYLRTRLR